MRRCARLLQAMRPRQVSLPGIQPRAPRQRRLTSVVVLTIATLASITLPGSGIASAADCSDVEVMFARGTNEAPGVGEIGQQFIDAFSPRLDGKTMSVYAVNYPASYDFARGVDGVVDATQHLESIAATCPDTKIVLGGYSQGAAVAGYTLTDTFPPGFVLPPGLSGALPPSVGSHIAAVILFGTPQTWVVNLLAREAPPMIIPPQYTDKTLQLCAAGDPVCADGGVDRAAHRAYIDNGMIGQAADFAARAI